MEMSVERSHTFIVSLIEQYVNKTQDAIDCFKTNMDIYLGPLAIQAITKCPQLPLPPLPLTPITPPLPIPVPYGISDDDVATTVERIRQLDSQNGRQVVEMDGLTKVMEYLTWMSDWARFPISDYVLQLLPFVEEYNNQLYNALLTFTRNWNLLRVTVLESPSAARSPALMFPMLGTVSAMPVAQPPPLSDDCLRTVQKFEEPIKRRKYTKKPKYLPVVPGYSAVAPNYMMVSPGFQPIDKTTCKGVPPGIKGIPLDWVGFDPTRAPTSLIDIAQHDIVNPMAPIQPYMSPYPPCYTKHIADWQYMRDGWTAYERRYATVLSSWTMVPKNFKEIPAHYMMYLPEAPPSPSDFHPELSFNQHLHHYVGSR